MQGMQGGGAGSSGGGGVGLNTASASEFARPPCSSLAAGGTGAASDALAARERGASAASDALAARERERERAWTSR
jgi:hypothetical protein